MQLIPFHVDKQQYNVFVILEDENIRRMRDYDPAQFDLSKLPPEWTQFTLKTVIIGYATRSELGKIREMVANGKGLAALEWLSRGFAYRPELGDHDKPYR